MRLRRALTALAVAAVAAATVAATPVGETDDNGRLVVGEDPAGDWNGGDGAEAGSAAGQDLVSASIGMAAEADEPTVDFVIGVTELPPIGGTPEATRYTWGFTVDGETLELDGKFTNYTRGACDPTSGQCPPPRDPGMQPFFVRGNCSTNEGNVTTCEELATVQATFDPATSTIVVPVTLELLGGAPCSVIGAGSTIFGGSIAAAPSAFLSINTAGFDFMFVDADFRVPSEDGTPCPPLED